MDMTNGLNQRAETTLATSLWPGPGDMVACLEQMLSPAALMGGCHAGFTPLEGVFHPSVPPSAPHSHSKSQGWTQPPHAPGEMGRRNPLSSPPR